MFSCRSLWSEKGLQAQNVKGFSGDPLPTLPDGASAFPSISFHLLLHSLCSGSVLRKLFPFSGTPGSCFIRRACPHRQLSQPAWAEAQPSGLTSSSAAHRRFRGGSSLHLKRYSRKNGYIVFGFHPRPIGRELPAERVKLFGREDVRCLSNRK